MARARGEESELYNGTGQTTPLPRAASTQYFSLGDDEDVLAARPLALDEQRPRVRVLRRTVEQIGDVVPLVPALADSVPQVVDQLVAVLARFDTPIADLVIEVPKVSCPPRCARTVQCTPQTVEQLVEVPTILSFISLQQQTAEQIVDIPLPGRGGDGGRRGLQSLLPGQNTTAQSAQIVDIPVPRGQDFLPRHVSTAFFAAHQPAVEYVAPAPVALVVVFKTLSQDRVQQRFSEMEDLVVVFKTLSQDRVQQRLVEQMMSMTSSGAPKSYWGTPAESTRFLLRRKRRRRRRSRWTLRSSPRASKAISAPGASVPPSSEVVSAGGVRRALSRTRMTSSTQTCRDNGDGCPCDHAAQVPAVQGASVHRQLGGSCCF